MARFTALAGAAAAALLAMGHASAATQDSDLKDLVPSITVEGFATRDVKPDIAVISLGVTTDRPSAADAAARNNETAAAILSELKTAGIPDHDVETTRADLAPVFGTEASGATRTKITSFRASNLIEVRVRDLAAVGSLVGRLIDKGANALQGIDFTVSNPGPVVDALRTEATRDARRKAEIYAGAAGVKLGRILGIAPDGSGPLRAAGHMKVQAMVAPRMADMPLQAGVETLESRVSITWEITP